MNSLTQIIIKAGDANRVLSARKLDRLLGGSDARRYGQVNRALKTGELLKIRRGLYVLAQDYRLNPVQPFALAQQMVPASYISLETALSFHGWIPEAVYTVASMIHGGKSQQFRHDLFGQFEFHRMTVNKGYFLHAVTRYQLQNQVALIADPMRALLDLVYKNRLPWNGMGFLLEGLRIDEDLIRAVPSSDIIKLMDVYKGKRERRFIEELLRSL